METDESKNREYKIYINATLRWIVSCEKDARKLIEYRRDGDTYEVHDENDDVRREFIPF